MESRALSGLHGFKRPLLLLAYATLIAVIAWAVGWSTALIFAPPNSSSKQPEYVLAEAKVGIVQDQAPLRVTSLWAQAAELANQATGVITSVDSVAGAMVEPGTQLYSVGLRPVIAGEGAIPSFRVQSIGVTGKDVEQLQSLLSSAGVYSGKTDGHFGQGTFDAVKRWQRANSVEPDGIVLPGDVVYFPTLPTRITFDLDTISLGRSLVGGEMGIRTLASEPTFEAATTPLQARLVTEGTRVSIGPDNWEATVAAHRSTDDGNVIVTFAAESGSSVCGDACASIAIEGQTVLNALAITVPTQRGVTLPTAAIRSNADGTTVVFDHEGHSRPIEVLASAKGQSVVNGVPAGTRVRIGKRT